MSIYVSRFWCTRRGISWIRAVGSLVVSTVLLLDASSCVAQTRGAQSLGARDSLPGRIVDVKAGEFFFQAPDTIPAGLTTFRLQQVGLVVDRVRAGAKGQALVSDQGNATRGLHMLWVVRLEEGKTANDLFQAAVASQPTPWARNLGGPGFSLPPGTSNATLELEPGSYALVCHVGASTGDRTRHHLLSGMFRTLTVLPAGRRATAAPDVVARITGAGTVEFSKPLVAGRQVIRVENATVKDHEFKLQKVPAGQTGKDWLMPHPGAEPATPWGGLASVPRGGAVTMTINFEPGEYVVSTWPAIRHPTSGVIVVAARPGETP